MEKPLNLSTKNLQLSLRLKWRYAVSTVVLVLVIIELTITERHCCTPIRCNRLPLETYPTILHHCHANCFQGVRSSSEFTRRCYLHIFKVVIKTLAARRLMNQRKVFQELTTSLFVYIVGLWNTHLQGGVTMLSEGDAESAVSTLQLAKVCLKSE